MMAVVISMASYLYKLWAYSLKHRPLLNPRQIAFEVNRDSGYPTLASVCLRSRKGENVVPDPIIVSIPFDCESLSGLLL
jgi:hypothetical protein